VLVDVVRVYVMQMPIMKIVDMAIVQDGLVSTVRAMLMGMVGRVILSAIGHEVSSWWDVTRRNNEVRRTLVTPIAM